MKLQKFEAESMGAALQKVKAALGPDAVIMDTRSVRKPGVLGIGGGHECVQVWAAHALEEMAETAPAAGVGAGASAPRLDTGLLTALHARLGDLEAKLDLLTMAAAYGSGAWARREAQAQTPEGDRVAALAALARRIPVSGEIALGTTRVVALVGPTGGGKTLTAAKLAGRFALEHQTRVGVISADGFRAGAIEEMQTYCGLLEVPVVHARDDLEIKAALETHSDRDLILIDTAGASQRNEQQLRELQVLLGVTGAQEVHLVLPAVSSHEACVQAIARFVRVGATHLIFTKLDESPDPAEALAAAIGSGRPISYLAAGQAVPHDLRPADEAHLVRVLTQDALRSRERAVAQRAG